jgi:hypothetical protein
VRDQEVTSLARFPCARLKQCGCPTFHISKQRYVAKALAEESDGEEEESGRLPGQKLHTLDEETDQQMLSPLCLSN